MGLSIKHIVIFVYAYVSVWPSPEFIVHNETTIQQHFCPVSCKDSDFTLWGSGSRDCRLKYSHLNPPSGGSHMWCRSLNRWGWGKKKQRRRRDMTWIDSWSRYKGGNYVYFRTAASRILINQTIISSISQLIVLDLDF